MRIKSCASAFLGLGLGSYLLLSSGVADATIKLHAASCHLQSGTLQQDSTGVFGFWSTSGSLTAICAFPEDTAVHPKSGIDEVIVYGHREDNPFLPGDVAAAKVCRTFATSDGGECGSESIFVGAGEFQLTPPLTVWNNSTGFPYVYFRNEGHNPTLRGVALD